MQAGVAAGAPADETSKAFAEAHARLMRDGALQFDRTSYQIPEAPDWLTWLADLLAAAGPVLKWGFWAAVAIVVAAILYAVAREIVRLRAPLARPRPMDLTVSDWRPDIAAARDLLTAADALAAQGLYAEAAHLILLRSVEDIESRRPRAVRPALTTREISSLAALPAAARPAFAQIGALVEASLFGGAPVRSGDFAACRAAYEAFALPDGWDR